MADHAVHRHARRCARSGSDDQHRRPGRVGRKPGYSGRRSGQSHLICLSFTTELSFYLGDVHASQGDTEFTGTAAETKARVRLRLELEHGKRIPGMRIEKPESLVAIHAEKPLDLAVETATIHLMDWLISEYGFSPVDAYCLISTCPDFRINVYQMCRIRNLRPVAGAEIPKVYVLA